MRLEREMFLLKMRGLAYSSWLEKTITVQADRGMEDLLFLIMYLTWIFLESKNFQICKLRLSKSFRPNC